MATPSRGVADATASPEEFTSDWAQPPGAILQEELATRGMSQAELALRASLSAKHVNRLIKAVVPLSPDVAIALERTLDVPADFWLRAEAAWRANRTRVDAHAHLGRFTEWLAKFPTRDLIARGLIRASDDAETRIDQLLRFFRVTDVSAFDRVWLQPQANFKRSQGMTVDRYATALWLRLAEVSAEARINDIKRFDAKRFRQSLPEIRALTRLSMPQGFIDARALLGDAGVVLVYVPEVASTRICGASRWLSSGHPFIALTNRFKSLDSFWFRLAHEAAHILLHPSRATYIDEDRFANDDADELETMADRFALQTFFSHDTADRIRGMPIKQIESLAEELGISAAIVAGQHGRLNDSWRSVSKYRPRPDLDSVLAGI